MLQSTEIPIFRPSRDSGLDTALRQAIDQVLDSRWYILGKSVARFEGEFADYCGVNHCISVANGTDALELGLRALGVAPGDTVLLVANAGFYGSTAVHALQARPFYVDVDEKTLTMCPVSLAATLAELRPKPKAIIVTHLYGRLADMERLLQVAQEHQVPLLEDCAQAHGARSQGRCAGSWGALGCFSFYPTKNLGALGDGGAIVTQDSELAESLRQLRQYGWGQKYHVQRAGGRNSRLDELQAAILSAKLPMLDDWNRARRELAKFYVHELGSLDWKLPDFSGPEYVGHLFVARHPGRDSFREGLKSRGVASDVHYPLADYQQSAYANSQVLEVTQTACQQVVTLPCFPDLTEAEAQVVVRAVREAF